MGFAKFWVREFFHFPIEYIDAFLLNTKGYWYVDDTTFGDIYEKPGVGAIIIEQWKSYDIKYRTLLPKLADTMKRLFTQNEYRNVPGMSTLIHPATYTWLLLLCLTWAGWRKRREVLVPGLLMLSYLFTLFLGPCALVRYIYYLMSTAPLMVAMLMAPAKKTYLTAA